MIRRIVLPLALTVLMVTSCSSKSDDKTASPQAAPAATEAAAATVAAEATEAALPVETVAATQAPPQVIKMPNLVGLTEPVAREQLIAAGVKPELIVVSQKETTSPVGSVLDQNPSAGNEARGAVTLFVAAPLKPMESFANRTIGELKAYLDQRGVTVREEVVLDDAKPDGTIIEHTPSAGQQLGPEVIAKVSRKPVTFALADIDPIQTTRSIVIRKGEYATNGTTYLRSLAVYDDYNPEGEWFEYNLGRDWRFLRGTIGIADDASSDAKVRVDVFGDGNPIYTKELTLGMSEPIDIDVTDRLRLRIQITGTEDSDVIFGDLRLVGSPDQVASTTTVPAS